MSTRLCRHCMNFLDSHFFPLGRLLSCPYRGVLPGLAGEFQTDLPGPTQLLLLLLTSHYFQVSLQSVLHISCPLGPYRSLGSRAFSSFSSSFSLLLFLFLPLQKKMKMVSCTRKCSLSLGTKSKSIIVLWDGGCAMPDRWQASGKVRWLSLLVASDRIVFLLGWTARWHRRGDNGRQAG